MLHLSHFLVPALPTDCLQNCIINYFWNSVGTIAMKEKKSLIKKNIPELAAAILTPRDRWKIEGFAGKRSLPLHTTPCFVEFLRSLQFTRGHGQNAEIQHSQEIRVRSSLFFGVGNIRLVWVQTSPRFPKFVRDWGILSLFLFRSLF